MSDVKTLGGKAAPAHHPHDLASEIEHIEEEVDHLLGEEYEHA